MNRRWPISGLVMAVLWLFVRSIELTSQRLLEEFIIGLGVGMDVTFFFQWFYGDEAPITRSLRVAPYATLYLATFLWRLLTTNVDVAVRMLPPSMPIDPAMVEVPPRVRMPLAITTIVNNITLTPGTLTMDYDDEASSLYVHSIDGSDPDGILKSVRRWEGYALVILDEESEPGDPAPQAEGGPAGGDDASAVATGGEQRG